MLPRSRAISLVVTGFAALLPLAIAACGASEADKTPSQILQDAATATKAVSTYHLSGAGQSGGSAVTFDLHIGGPGESSGSLTMSGVTANLVVVNNAAYLEGRAFMQQIAGAGAAATIGDNWVKLPASAATGLTQSFAALTDTKKVGGCLVDGFKGVSLSKSTGTLNGQPVVVLRAPALVLDFAASGPTYLLQAKSTGSTPGFDACMNGSSSGSSGSTPGTGNGGTIHFDSWGSGVSITPPPHPVDLSNAGG